MENLKLGTYKIVKQPNQHGGTFLFKVKRFLKTIFILLTKMTALSFAIVMVFVAGQMSVADHVMAQTVTVKESYPILQRIAGCESEGNPNSKGSQFDSKGKLRKHVNADKTVDIGKNMINEYFWEATAVSLGYNIYSEEGNDAMAKWLFLNKGTGDWLASQKCWKK